MLGFGVMGGRSRFKTVRLGVSVKWGPLAQETGGSFYSLDFSNTVDLERDLGDIAGSSANSRCWVPVPPPAQA